MRRFSDFFFRYKIRGKDFGLVLLNRCFGQKYVLVSTTADILRRLVYLLRLYASIWDLEVQHTISILNLFFMKNAICIISDSVNVK
jgi:hypothetical protein